MKRIIILALAIGALSFVLADSASATCAQTGGIARVTATPGATVTTIYIRNSALSTVFWTATTTDQKIVNLAAAAAANNRRVAITGNAATCPTTGNLRPIGVVVQFILGP
jgi:hypothetical protein